MREFMLPHLPPFNFFSGITLHEDCKLPLAERKGVSLNFRSPAEIILRGYKGPDAARFLLMVTS